MKSEQLLWRGVNIFLIVSERSHFLKGLLFSQLVLKQYLSKSSVCRVKKGYAVRAAVVVVACPRVFLDIRGSGMVLLFLGKHLLVHFVSDRWSAGTVPIMARLRLSWYLIILLLLMSFVMISFPFSGRAVTIVVHEGESIQLAINLASPGDTILVSNGTYHERFTINKMVHLAGAGGATVIIDGQTQGPIINVVSDYVSIAGFTVQNAGPDGQAIHAAGVTYLNVTNNIIMSDISSGSRPLGAGVDLYRSNFTLVDKNVFSYNLYGVNITSSSHNRVTNNMMRSNDLIGVELVDSSQNLVFQNNLASGEEGVDMNGALTSINNVTRNLLRGMSIAGVFMGYFANGNILNENTLQLNHIGVDLQNATGNPSAPPNIFYHNSFLRSGFRHVNHVVASDLPLNYWDNASLTVGATGGNYWDDYAGVDTNYDGIGNTSLPADTVDHYPLIRPFLPVPLAVAKVSSSKTSGTVPLTVMFQADVLGTLTPFMYQWDFGDNSSLSNEVSPSHTYTVLGNHTVRVVVRDASGTTDIGMVVVLVEKPSSSEFPYVSVAFVMGIAGVAGVVIFRRRRSRKERSRKTGSVKASRL